MKKIVLLLLTIVSVTASRADDFEYGYLAFVDSNGKEQTIATEDLRITFDDGKLIAVSQSDGLTLQLADLAKMYFTTTATGIAGVSVGDGSETVKVYSTTGTFMGTFASRQEAERSLRHGVYVIKTEKRTTKLAVK